MTSQNLVEGKMFIINFVAVMIANDINKEKRSQKCGPT